MEQPSLDRQIGDFKPIRFLAHWTLGERFIARNVDDGPSSPAVIVDCLWPELNNFEGFDEELDKIEKWRKVRHPVLARVMDVGYENDRAYIASEFFEGRSLEALIHRRETAGEPIPPRVALETAFHLAEGLSALHTARSGRRPLGLIHGGLNPTRILLDNRARVKILGGWSSRLEARLPWALPPRNAVYQAPEELWGLSTVDQRADLWSLGVVLFETFIGRFCPADAPLKFVRRVLRRDAREAHGMETLPAPLREVLTALLEREPAQRPQNASEVADALRHLLDGRASVEVPKAEVKAPKAEVKAQKAELEAPKAEVMAPKVEVKAPKMEVKAPKAEVMAPKVEVKAPKAEVMAPKAIEVPPTLDPKTPQVSPHEERAQARVSPPKVLQEAPLKKTKPVIVVEDEIPPDEPADPDISLRVTTVIPPVKFNRDGGKPAIRSVPQQPEEKAAGAGQYDGSSVRSASQADGAVQSMWRDTAPSERVSNRLRRASDPLHGVDLDSAMAPPASATPSAGGAHSSTTPQSRGPQSSAQPSVTPQRSAQPSITPQGPAQAGISQLPPVQQTPAGPASGAGAPMPERAAGDIRGQFPSASPPDVEVMKDQDDASTTPAVSTPMPSDEVAPPPLEAESEPAMPIEARRSRREAFPPGPGEALEFDASEFDVSPVSSGDELIDDESKDEGVDDGISEPPPVRDEPPSFAEPVVEERVEEEDTGPLTLQEPFAGKPRGFLIYREGSTREYRYALTGNLVTLGRSSQNTYQILSEIKASRFHCEFQFNEETENWILVDKRSTNGTYVNGQPVEVSELKGREKINIGFTTFRFLMADAEGNPRDATSDQVTRTAELAKVRPPTSRHLRAALVRNMGTPNETHHEITGDVFLVGSASGNSLQLHDPLVAPCHCEIRYQDGQYVIEDHLSEHGTLVNGFLVDTLALEGGEEITVGGEKMRLVMF